jgi:hypothetical protein
MVVHTCNPSHLGRQRQEDQRVQRSCLEKQHKDWGMTQVVEPLCKRVQSAWLWFCSCVERGWYGWFNLTLKQ